MAMRITTNMMMNNYRFNLQGSTSNLTKSRNKVLSHRNFDSYAENPSAATQAWRLRRAIVDNDCYVNNNANTYSRFDIAWQTLGTIKKDLADESAKVASIRAVTTSTGSARKPLGQVLKDTADSVIQAMNSAKYGDHFVFAGDDEQNAPFSWSADGKTLYYRGIDVNTADANEKALLDRYFAEEENVDLGMGLQENNGKLINGTAFDRSLPGIKMLGYGTDADGDPQNIALIMKRLGEILENCDADSGDYASTADREEAERLMDKLSDANHRLIDSYTEVETKAHFLQENQTRLETQGDYLEEETLNIEQVDLADAITSFSWDYYCYSAALKVGTQLLSQSLIDYMN